MAAKKLAKVAKINGICYINALAAIATFFLVVPLS